MAFSRANPFILLIIIVTVSSCKFVSGETANTKLSISQNAEQELLRQDFPSSQLSSQRFLMAEEVSSQYSCLRNGSRPCPPWSFCDSADGTCKCVEKLSGVLECDSMGQLTGILTCYCVTHDEQTNVTEIGLCAYNCAWHFDKLVDVVYRSLPYNCFEWNEAMCGFFNRTGTLCGKCKDGFYPRAYSFDLTCIECPDGKSCNWLRYVLSAFLPLTVFYFIILLLKINIPSSQLQGIVAQFLGALYGIWNLDFLRWYDLGICLQTDTLATLALDLAVAVYPLLLMAVTYMMISLYDSNFRPLVILWKPFHTFFGLFRRNWGIRTSTVDAFATFLFLSNVKFLSVCSDLLIPVQVHQFLKSGNYQDTNTTWRLYYNANIHYFGQDHLPYAILAIAVLFFFVIIPTLILFLYPFSLCQKCLHLLPGRWYIFLHTFVDSFQGCYKDGTEPGSRDYRWFSAVSFILRFSLVMVYGSTLNSTVTPYAAIMLVFTVIIILVVNPYKTHLEHFSYHLAMFIVLFSCFGVSIIGIDQSHVKVDQSHAFFNIISVVLVILPILYATILILHWIIRKFGMELIGRVKAWRQGYSSELM